MNNKNEIIFKPSLWSIHFCRRYASNVGSLERTASEVEALFSKQLRLWPAALQVMRWLRHARIINGLSFLFHNASWPIRCMPCWVMSILISQRISCTAVWLDWWAVNHINSAICAFQYTYYFLELDGIPTFRANFHEINNGPTKFHVVAQYKPEGYTATYTYDNGQKQAKRTYRRNGSPVPLEVHPVIWDTELRMWYFVLVRICQKFLLFHSIQLTVILAW